MAYRDKYKTILMFMVKKFLGMHFGMQFWTSTWDINVRIECSPNTTRYQEFIRERMKEHFHTFTPFKATHPMNYQLQTLP